MPIKKTAFKALRQTKKRTLQNKSAKQSIKLSIKAVRKAIEAGDYAKAEDALKAAIKKIDKAQQNKVLKKNTAGRHKSRLTKSLSKLKSKK